MPEIPIPGCPALLLLSGAALGPRALAVVQLTLAHPQGLGRDLQQFILIDELDKMNAADTAALLSMMEGGRLVRAKKGRELNIDNPIRVIAACNRLDMLSPELRSRFAVCRLTAYSRTDYLTVVKGVLVSREGLTQEMATEIANRLDGLSQDVRDAIRVARLTPHLGIHKAVNLLLGQRIN